MKSQQRTRTLSRICCQRNPDAAAQRAEIEAALAAGSDVGEADKNGVTPLHHAVRFRSLAALKTLLRHGAEVNRACTRSGSTALHRAVTSTGAPGTAGKSAEASKIVKILLRYGADPLIRNRVGKAPLDYVKDDSLRQMLKINKSNARQRGNSRQ